MRSERWVLVAAGVLMAAGVVRAATNGFVQKRDAMMKVIAAEAAAERKKLGLGPDDRLPTSGTPEVTLSKIVRATPGGTATVTVQGTFKPGTHFLFENDNVDVVKEVLAGTTYTATVHVAPGGGPGAAYLDAYAPATGALLRTPVLYIGGTYEWNFTAQNGWRIRLANEQEQFTPSGDAMPQPVFTVEFYKPNQAKPFEVRQLKMNLPVQTAEDATYSGDLSEVAAAGSVQDQIQQLGQKLADPKLPEDQREKMTEQLSALTDKMLQQMQAQLADPMAYAKKMEAAEAQFGCASMSFTASGATATGRVSCGANVGQLTITGSVKPAGK